MSFGMPELAADHVGHAAGQERERDLGAGSMPVDDLVGGAVAAEGADDVVVARPGPSRDDLGRVVALARVDRLDLVAACSA